MLPEKLPAAGVLEVALLGLEQATEHTLAHAGRATLTSASRVGSLRAKTSKAIKTQKRCIPDCAATGTFYLLCARVCSAIRLSPFPDHVMASPHPNQKPTQSMRLSASKQVLLPHEGKIKSKYGKSIRKA